MTKFKVGDLVIPTSDARKQFRFNKNMIFPWEVMRVEWPVIWVQRFSKVASSRVERWHEDWFVKVEG